MTKWPNVIALVLATALSGCASDRPASVSANLCAGLDRFVTAGPSDAPRSALIFWPEDDPDKISFYAALQASPLDEAARAFHRAYAQTTHYITIEELGARFKTCLANRPERMRVVHLETSKAACHGTPSSQACISINVDPARAKTSRAP